MRPCYSTMGTNVEGVCSCLRRHSHWAAPWLLGGPAPGTACFLFRAIVEVLRPWDIRRRYLQAMLQNSTLEWWLFRENKRLFHLRISIFVCWYRIRLGTDAPSKEWWGRLRVRQKCADHSTAWWGMARWSGASRIRRWIWHSFSQSPCQSVIGSKAIGER